MQNQGKNLMNSSSMSKERFILMVFFIISCSPAVLSKTLADSLVTGFWNTILLMQYNGEDDSKHKVVDKSIFFGRPLVSATTTQRPCEYGYIRDDTGTCIRIFQLDDEINSLVNLNVILHNFGYGSDSDYSDDGTTEEEDRPGERFQLDLPLQDNIITDSLEEMRNPREHYEQPLENQKDHFKLSTKSTIANIPVIPKPSTRFATTKLPGIKYSKTIHSVTQPAIRKSTTAETAMTDFTSEPAITRSTRTKFPNRSTTTVRAMRKSSIPVRPIIKSTTTEPAITKSRTLETTITDFTLEPAVTRSTRTKFSITKSTTTERAIRKSPKTERAITKPTRTEFAIAKSATMGHAISKTTITEPTITKSTTMESTITKFTTTKSIRRNSPASKIKIVSLQNEPNLKLYEYLPKVSFMSMSSGNATLKNSKKISSSSSTSSEQTKRKKLYLNPILFHGDSIEVDSSHQKSGELVIKNEIDPIRINLID